MGLYYKGENIQGAVAEGGGEVYSKEEIVIGTWQNADGTVKPLYRKVVHCIDVQNNTVITIPNYSNMNVDFLNISGVICLAKWDTGTQIILSSKKFSYDLTKGNGTIDFSQTATSSTNKFDLTLIFEYTKTTDAGTK